MVAEQSDQLIVWLWRCLYTVDLHGLHNLQVLLCVHLICNHQHVVGQLRSLQLTIIHARYDLSQLCAYCIAAVFVAQHDRIRGYTSSPQAPLTALVQAAEQI